jgi:hypothetical protein
MMPKPWRWREFKVDRSGVPKEDFSTKIWAEQPNK